MNFRGTYTALVTPFSGGAIDYDGYAKLLDMQKAAGVAGIMPCGCTGEAATVEHDERMRLLTTALERVGDSVQVIPGTGTNSTKSTIERTKEAEAAGAHAAMLITPYYNKPSQQGLYEHYARIGEATTIPLILYNVPGRTGVTLSTETIARLYETGRYPAIKEAAGSIEAVSDMTAACDITVLSGDDSLTLAMMAMGAEGVVSVVSNIVPETVNDMVTAALDGDYKTAREVHYRLLPMMRAAFIESNPSPMKAMLAARGVIENELRPPLAPVSDHSLTQLNRVLQGFTEAERVSE